MAQSFTGKKRIRKSFGRIPEAVQMPNLIEVQRSSYEQFLQRETRPDERRIEGIEARVPLGVPDQGLQRARHARIRVLRVRGPEIRRRRVHPARHDLCRAAEGEAAPDRVRDRRGDRRPLGEGHQGAGRLHGRHPAHDRQGHVHRQRHRAGHRLPDAPLARASSSTTTRARPTRRASCCSPRGSSPTAAPGSTSSSTPRTSSSCGSTGVASCRPRPSSMASAWMARRSSPPSMTSSRSRSALAAGPPPTSPSAGAA